MDDYVSITVRFSHAERINNSYDGNPRWRIHTDIGNYNTAPNSAVASVVSNHNRGSDESWTGKLVRLRLMSYSKQLVTGMRLAE